MKIDVVIPTRGERKEFLDFALNELIPRQTMQPNDVILVDHKPKGGNDLLERYRMGITQSKADLIIFWEDDDYYAPNYIEKMAAHWVDCEKPEIIGIGETFYYHLKDLRYKHHSHPERASACNTAISQEAKEHINWRTYKGHFDLALWRDLNGRTFYEPTSLGIKHGIGLCGGRGHSGNYMDTDDRDMNWLRSRVEPWALDFYYQMHRKLIKL